jgi:pyrroloquinoline quinone (PQQ) biosynthesis protein C
MLTPTAAVTALETGGSMDTFQQLLEATAPDYREHILGNPLFQLIAGGKASRDQYAVYLRETYQLVRHTSRALALGASRCDDEHRELRAWLLDQANDEHGHELFCLKDLKHLGVVPESVTCHSPGAGAWGVVTQNYYLAACGRPVCLLGVASATEGMGAELAGDLARTLVGHYGIPEIATTFLRSHAGFDQRHFEEAKRAINTLIAGPDEFAGVAHARRMTFRYYGQLFREVAASTECLCQIPPALAA